MALAKIASVYVNSVSPTKLELDVTSAQDISTTVSATIAVKRPDATTTSWVASVANVTVSSCTVTYIFQTGDVAQIGEYFVRADLTLSGGGIVKTSAEPLLVIDGFQPLQ